MFFFAKIWRKQQIMIYYYNLNKNWEELDTQQLSLRRMIFAETGGFM